MHKAPTSLKFESVPQSQIGVRIWKSLVSESVWNALLKNPKDNFVKQVSLAFGESFGSVRVYGFGYAEKTMRASLQVPTSMLERILTVSVVSTCVSMHEINHNDVYRSNLDVIWLNHATIEQARNILPHIPKHVGIAIREHD
eukprot:9501694-Karenia_brevis.AAC.1